MEKKEKPVTVHITNHNKFEKGVGAFITNLNHLTLVMDAEGNMKMDMGGVPVMPHTKTEVVPSDEDSHRPAEEDSHQPLALTDAQLARVVEQCQAYFWGNASYAVLFCLLRDEHGMADNQTQFETMVEQLPYRKQRDHKCPPGTIASAMSRTPLYRTHVTRWEAQGAAERILKLLGELRQAISRQGRATGEKSAEKRQKRQSKT